VRSVRPLPPRRSIERYGIDAKLFDMSALAVGGIVFECVFGGAVCGMFLGAILPKDHLSADSKDVIKVAIAMIATLAALGVGLSISPQRAHSTTKIPR
jgi:hypothetical protein